MSGESGMGWREDAELHKALRYLCHGVGSNEEVFAALLSMPAPARIAFARELLAGTGRVVARDVYVPERYPSGSRARDGWNACRAAMMGDGE